VASAHTVVWQRATVIDNVALTPAIQRIVFRPEHPAKAPPGSHIDVRVSIDGDDSTRSYSIVDASPAGRTLAISVFASEASRGGAAVMHALRVGDVIEMTQPLQDFPLRFGAPSYVLLAGGIGITAIAGMAASVAAAGGDYRVVYCGRARALRWACAPQWRRPLRAALPSRAALVSGGGLECVASAARSLTWWLGQSDSPRVAATSRY